MNSIAKVVSFLLHPLWMPLITLLLLYILDPYLGLNSSAFRLLVVLLLICIIAPGMSLLVMVKTKMVSDIEVSNKKERYIPFALVISYYIMAYLFLKFNKVSLPNAVYAMLFGLIISLVIAVLVNMITKVSIHLMAMGGVLGTLLAFSQIHLIGIGMAMSIWLLLSSILAWSRIHQGLHTNVQTYFGFALGFCLHYFFVVNEVFW